MDEENAHIEVELSFPPESTGGRNFYTPSDYQDGAKFDFVVRLTS